MRKVKNRIEVVKKAIEFKDPEYIPLELIEIPGLWDDYMTISVDEVDDKFIALEDFDIAEVYYSWLLKRIGKDKEGNIICNNEWGNTVKIPKDKKYSHFVTKEPLKNNWENIKRYKFPDPEVANGYIKGKQAVIEKYYKDKFITLFLDPGISLLGIFLRGYEDLLVDYYKYFERVEYLFENIWEFQKEIIKKFKKIGIHAVHFYEEWADQRSMYVSPDWWREKMKPFYKKVFEYVHDLGLYTGIGSDGNIIEILPDFKEIGLDVLDNRQPLLLGIDNLAKIANGKLCIKGSVDMQLSYPVKSSEEVKAEAEELAFKLGIKRNGGFIAFVYKWKRLNIPVENVLASLEGFNKFRNHFFIDKES